jgi:hypothetical protein
MRKVWVLCCDDSIGERTIDIEFAANPDTAAGRIFQRLGPIRPTAEEAMNALRDGWRRNEFPQVVLIDNWLGGNRRPGDARPAGLVLMREITDAFGDRRPTCVLASGRMTPTLAHAFCLAGGVQAIDAVRHAPAWRDRIAIMWRAVDGVVWTPTPNPAKVFFDADELQLLPYLEAGRGNVEIRNALFWNDDKLTRVRRKIYRRLELCGLIDEPYNTALTTALAEAALAGGAIWSPLYAGT